jgi:hypothetical protein
LYYSLYDKFLNSSFQFVFFLITPKNSFSTTQKKTNLHNKKNCMKCANYFFLSSFVFVLLLCSKMEKIFDCVFGIIQSRMN